MMSGQNDKSLISVIIPVYNVENYLEKCLESVKNQTYRNLEIILVDDGSEDSSGLMCDKAMEEDNRITVVHQKNRGLAGARNRGMEMANGEYIAFVDADDYIYSRMYEVLHDFIVKTESDIAIGGIVRTCNEKYFSNKRYERFHIELLEKEDAMLQMFYNYTEAVSACNKLYKRELFKHIRYPEGKIYEDEFVTYKLLYYAEKVVFIKEKMYAYLQRTGSIVHSFNENAYDDKIEAYKQMISFCKEKGAMRGYEKAIYRYLDFRREYYGYCNKCKKKQSKEIRKEILKESDGFGQEIKFELKNRLKKGLFHVSPTVFHMLKTIMDKYQYEESTY